MAADRIYDHDTNEATRRRRELLFTEEVRGEIIGGEDQPQRYAFHRYSDGARIAGPWWFSTDAEAIAHLDRVDAGEYGWRRRYPEGLELRVYD